MKQTSQNHKDMKDTVKPWLLGADTIQYRAKSVGNSSEEDQKKSGLCQNLYNLPGKGNNGLTHCNVADHGKHIVFF